MSQPLPSGPTENSANIVGPGLPASGPSLPAPVPAVAKHLALETNVGSLLARGKNGAHWFYWVAALSLVNSVIALSGGQIHFVIGLGVTLIADSLASGLAQQMPDVALVLKGAAFVFDVCAAAAIALFGWMSAKRYTIVMAIGMVLYLLDGTLYLLIQDWMSIGFHAFALYCMWCGLAAYRQLNTLEESLARPAVVATSQTTTWS